MQRGFIYRKKYSSSPQLAVCVWSFSSGHKRNLHRIMVFTASSCETSAKWDLLQGIIIIFWSKTGERGGTHSASSSANTFSAPSLLTHLQSHFNWGVIICKEQTEYQRAAGRGWRGWGEQSESEPWRVGRSPHAAQASPVPRKTHSAQSQTEAAENTPNQTLKPGPLLHVCSRLVLTPRKWLQTVWLMQNLNKTLCQPCDGIHFVCLWFTGQNHGQVQQQTAETQYHLLLLATSSQVGFPASEIQSMCYT